MSRLRRVVLAAASILSVLIVTSTGADAGNKCRPVCQQPAACAAPQAACCPQPTCCRPQHKCCVPQMGCCQTALGLAPLADITYCPDSVCAEWYDDPEQPPTYCSYFTPACFPPDGIPGAITVDAACNLMTTQPCPDEPHADCVTISYRSLGIGDKANQRIHPTDPAKHPKLKNKEAAFKLRPKVDPTKFMVFSNDANWKFFEITVNNKTIYAQANGYVFIRLNPIKTTGVTRLGQEVKKQSLPTGTVTVPVHGRATADHVVEVDVVEGNTTVTYQIVTHKKLRD